MSHDADAPRLPRVFFAVFFAASFAVGFADEPSVEMGHRILEGVRAFHVMIDFGGEALDQEQQRALSLCLRLSSELGEPNDPTHDAFACRRRALRLERLARDLIAGRTVTKVNAALLEKHVRFAEDELTDLSRRLQEKGRAQLRQAASRALSVEPVSEEDSQFMGSWTFFVVADPTTDVGELPLDTAAAAKLYPSASKSRQRLIRFLLGLRGQADEHAVALLLTAMEGDEPIERYDVLWVAGRIRPVRDKLVAAMIGRLNDPDPRVARAAVRSLVRLEATAAAPAMLQRLRETVHDKQLATLNFKLGDDFDGNYPSRLFPRVGYRYDLSSELIYALGRLRCSDAKPLLWEIARGTGSGTWRYEGIYELGHGGVAVEAIRDIGEEPPEAIARHALALDGATLDALGSAANILGEHGDLADVPRLLEIMDRLDELARDDDHYYYQFGRTMSRTQFAAVRVMTFSDPGDPSYQGNRRNLIELLRRCAGGRFGPEAVAALHCFDPKTAAADALALAADTNAQPNARSIAIEMLGNAKNLEYIEPLVRLFEDDANCTNPPLGFHAAWAAQKILAVADPQDAAAAALAKRVADELERLELADDWRPTVYVRVLLAVDSDRGVGICSQFALDEKSPTLNRQIALENIRRFAKPNSKLAGPLRPLLSSKLEDESEEQALRADAAMAMARLLGIEFNEGAIKLNALLEKVQAALEKPEIKGEP
ncbi:MAG: HEAT repeat domain-containing protein [Planctomycetota bacterium]